MRVKGFVKSKNLGLCQAILESHGIVPEKDGDKLFFDFEADSFFYNRTKGEAILRELRKTGAEEGEIEAYSVVVIYKYTLGKNNEV